MPPSTSPLGAKGGFVDGHEHHLAVVGQHHGVEAGVQGAHVVGHKLGKLVEACVKAVGIFRESGE